VNKQPFESGCFEPKSSLGLADMVVAGRVLSARHGAEKGLAVEWFI
jgi:hypothetical protein